MSIIEKIGRYAINLTTELTPWTNVYGLARSFLALGTLITLLFNPSNNLFLPSVELPNYPLCGGLGNAGIFCVFAPNLEIARWLSVIILFIVLIGWRPRYTGLLHWWIAISLQSSAIITDGGDQVTTVLTLLLLPVTLTDNRKWHWQKLDDRNSKSTSETLKSLFALSALGVARLQVSIIYFHAATGKFFLEEWIDGTILYYWLNDPLIGLPAWLKFTLPIYSSRFVVIFTWGTLILEILLSMGLFMKKKYWKPLLIAGIIFHAGIALTMGLISFGCSMTAALILYLRPFNEMFDFSIISNFFEDKLSKRNSNQIANNPVVTNEES